MGQILVSDEAGVPSSPAAGNRNLFATAANGLQVKDAAGNLYQLSLISSGSAGKVPRSTAANVLTPGSLSDDGTNVTLASGGLNVGTTGASIGQVRALNEVYQQGIKINTPYYAKVNRTAAQTIANNTTTAIIFDTKEFDTDNMVNLVANATRITINHAGVYLVTGTFFPNWMNPYQTFAQIVLGGATVLAQASGYASTSACPVVTVTTIASFVATNYVELDVWQYSGAPLSSGVPTSFAVASLAV